jgi:predicted permease
MMRVVSSLLRGLLGRLLDKDEEHALGDLDEELGRRREQSARSASGELWYVREAMSLLLAVAAGRVAQTLTWETNVSGLGRDLRHALRALVREPGVSLVVTVTLATAIGATTAIFAVADAAYLRPLPYPSAERLVSVYSGSREDPAAAFALSPLDVRDIRGFDALVEDIGVWTVGETVHLMDGDEPRRLEAPRATGALFRMLGVEPEVGRFFLPEEEVPGDDDAVVLSWGLWASAFGSDPGVVGRSIRLDGRSYRVVGVAPAADVLPRGAEAWRALALGPEWYDSDRWGWQFLRGVARLRPGVTPEGASRALTDRLAAAVPQRVERGQTRVVRTLYEERVGTAGPGVLLLLSAVGLVLVMACANVASVMLARAERHTSEMGLRRALGSGPGSLVRGVLLEAGFLGALGCLGGLALARSGLTAITAAELEATAALGTLRIDFRVVGFALLVTMSTVVAFGAAPALRALRADPQTVLRESGARAGTSKRSARWRDFLVIAQVALACTLLASVGLSASAFLRLVDRDPGFRSEGVLTTAIELPAQAYDTAERVIFYRSLMARLRTLPGVTSAGAVQFLPLTGRNWSASIELVDPDPSVTDPDPGANMRPVAPGYFRTLGIPLLEGRAFTEADDDTTRPVVVVDRTTARRYWPEGSPVGRAVHVGALSRETATVVGVVESVPDESLARSGNGHVYFSVLQRPMRRMILALRTDGDPTALSSAVRAAVREADPRIPITDVATLGAVVQRSVAGPRVALLLLVAFGAVAVLLAAVGIYGVVAYAVARRTNEIGTRMALGAAPGVVLRSVVGRAMRLWGAGAALGVVGALTVGALIPRVTEEVRPGDPLPYLVAFAGLAAVALLAALLPAVRAIGVDPVEALRAE